MGALRAPLLLSVVVNEFLKSPLRSAKVGKLKGLLLSENHWAAKGDAIQVVMRDQPGYLWNRVIELVAIGIEGSIFVVLIDAAVVRVAPALELNIESSAGLPSVLGIIGGGHDAKLSHGVSRRHERHA